MNVDFEALDLDDFLTRALAVEVPPAARGRIRERLDAAAPVGPAVRRRGRKKVVALGLAAALLVAGTATGAHYLGEWGPVDHPATVAQIEDEIQAAVAAHPLPPGYTYPIDKIRGLAELDPAQHGGTLAVQQALMCGWTDYWLAGARAGDDAQMTAALPHIEAFPNLMLIGDPRFADDSIRDEIAQVVAGAKSGDAAPVQELWNAACSDAMVRRP